MMPFLLTLVQETVTPPSPPAGALVDRYGQPILDRNGDYIIVRP